jgi:hypothetical protein
MAIPEGIGGDGMGLHVPWDAGLGRSDSTTWLRASSHGVEQQRGRQSVARHRHIVLKALEVRGFQVLEQHRQRRVGGQTASFPAYTYLMRARIFNVYALQIARGGRSQIDLITRDDTRSPIQGCWGVSRSGRLRTCHDPRVRLTVAPAHLLGMDATTQITPALLTQHELAELLRLPERTLEDWRLTRTGPPDLKLGRHVRYDVQDVLAWAQEHRHG